jgi:cyclic beta-1,2-glucan synthetase
MEETPIKQENQNNSNFSNESVANKEQALQFINALADQFKTIEKNESQARSKKSVEEVDSPNRNLKIYANWLAEVNRYFGRSTNQNVSLSYASEWVLDNYHVIRQAIQQIEEDLPPDFYRQLPKLTQEPFTGYPRILAIAHAILKFQDLVFNPIGLEFIIVQYQEQVSLTMGELWALPIFLRYCLVEFLAVALVSAIQPDDPPQFPSVIPGLTDTNDSSFNNLSTSEIITNNNSVANIIISLRSIDEVNWSDFFESVSRLEKILQEDPSGIYPRMDFKTRDMYRKEIEKLSFSTGREECELAEIILNLAREGSVVENMGCEKPSLKENTPDTTIPTGLVSDKKTVELRSSHIGEYLIGESRPQLEKKIGYKPNIKTLLNQGVIRHASVFYFASIGLISIGFLILLALVFQLPHAFQFESTFINNFAWSVVEKTWLKWLILTFMGITIIVPLLTIATSVVNWLINLLIQPRILPKIDFKKYIPEPFTTLIAIPTLITTREDIDSLVKQLELHYLRNPQPGLLYALLSDFHDADTETLPEDESLIQYARVAIDRLNQKYQPQGSASAVSGGKAESPRGSTRLFYFLHRKRLWNPSEGKWMGWERKRGKLHELNLLLSGDDTSLSFINLPEESNDLVKLRSVRYVITLDTDTILPHGAAARLVGTMAHPLNQPVFDQKTGRVVSGYTILQPRMEIHPKSAGLSWFTRFFAGDAGLDLYTLAVSDSYQDFFGEGIYVGKGIYDVRAFVRSVNSRIPENSILSHDLLEGLMGRAGLVTDITMIEDYPQNYLIQTIRQRRWIRGDWQLLPWLLKPNRGTQTFSAIDRWKMFDNLRRSLLAPALILIYITGFIFLPSLIGLWTAVVILTFGIPILTGLARSAMQLMGGEVPILALRPFGWNIFRWLLAIAFLPYEAYISIDAILTTLYRLLFSHRNLLQWTTAAQTARVFGLQKRRNIAWRKMIISPLVVLVLIIEMYFFRGFIDAKIAFAAPILLLWVVSPFLVCWIDRPIIEHAVAPDEAGINLLRQVTRRTWGFFERFVGPEDHWLPPDHFQETPVGAVAHRTSPTNIGLLLTSTLAAYDLGYLDQFGLATRLDNTIETLESLECFRGHFLNWYDTQTLNPLTPRYISTVDSGNLAASLIIITQACKSMPENPIFRWDLWQGYLDTLSNLTEILKKMVKPEFDRQVNKINYQIDTIHAEILAARTHPEEWYPLFLKASGAVWHEISRLLMELLKIGHPAFTLKSIAELQEVTAQIERQHAAVQHTITELVPWIPLISDLPAQFREPHFVKIVDDLSKSLPFNLTLLQVHDQIKIATPYVDALENLISNGNGADSGSTPKNDGDSQNLSTWISKLRESLRKADARTQFLLEKYSQIAKRTEHFTYEMDFGFLYDTQRRVFHIGFNLDIGELDNNYYDLLASEARIASIVAIAKGDVPQSHWLHLNRPVRRTTGAYILLSWSGTMFEYLMPPLFLRSYPGTLLAESARWAVRYQIEYGKTRKVPWGISESGYFRFDANKNYQYRAFGMPGLGFKRGLGDDLVIAPYASLMAISYDPQAVVNNLIDFTKRNMLGSYGLYEAIDFTKDRLPLDESSAIVGEYMAHHQGMILMAMVNFFHDDIMVSRMHSDPHIQSVDLLLQEQLPQSATALDPLVEDAQARQQFSAAPEEIAPWSVPIQTPIPQIHLLSNGSYSLFLSNSGGGYSKWRDIVLTRWQSDGVMDPWGTWIYLQEIEDNKVVQSKLWSIGHQPIPGDANKMKVTFHPHMIVYRRTENRIASTMEVTVAPDDPVEIRRIHLQNNNDQSRTIRLTSYGEVILGSQDADTRHPAFNKMFIESEFVPELNLQIFNRRPRSSQETTIVMGHMLVRNGEVQTARHEADRYRFIGRNHTLRNPEVLLSGDYLTGTIGATLDPIFSLGQELTIKSHQGADFAYLTFTAESKEKLIELANRYRSWNLIERSFHQANIASQAWLGKQEINGQSLKDILQVLSAMLYPFKSVRTSPEVLAKNTLGQPGLWGFGISGDYPIMVVEIDDPKQSELVQEALKTHKFLRSRRMMVDLIILNNQQTDYGAELNGLVYRMVNRIGADEWLNQRGGIFILYSDQMRKDERVLLQTVARVFLSGARGSIKEQLPGYSVYVHHLPEFNPIRAARVPMEALPSSHLIRVEKKTDLKFYNGYGGFSADGREYIIDLPDGKTTPAPWVNVIGYPQFGFLVSEAGSQCTWSLNSGENRLTSWSNDPVRDLTGEALYLRDEETSEVWTPTPFPSGADQPYRITHGAGYTTFEHTSHGLTQCLTLFASPEDPVKIIHLKVQNTEPYPRRITATQYVEWVLGTTHANSMPYIIPEYDTSLECLLASNPYNSEFGERVAFLIASKAIHGLTGDRTEFIGRNGTAAFPAALHRLGLETRITPGEDPCAVLQLHLDLLPNGTEEIYFVLGQGKDKEHALELAKKYKDPGYVGFAYERTHVFWDKLLDTIQVETPNPATDLIMNRWMLYQALSCRVWGRTAFYQSSGAFGYRDQLQDVLALLPIDPAITRSQILNAARHQFEEGDVMHWWHPPSSRGVRTRISDDLLWLPYVTAKYIEVTGDIDILNEPLPFRKAPVLAEESDENYGAFPETEQNFSLLEHCFRSIEKGATSSPHGLPFIGTGDWNDGLNRVGKFGKGESVWLAWFLCDVLTRFAEVCDQIGSVSKAKQYRHMAVSYAAAVEENSWDGNWYQRATYDNGTPLGSANNTEGKIDAIAQSWAVLSGAGDPQRSYQAMQSVLEHLIFPDKRLSLLFTPPFDKTLFDPGYIKGYLPGIRENGGQYTHAATWTAWAFAKLGDGEQAEKLFDLLNPIRHADTQDKTSRYRVEPYVISADVYSKAPYVGRGGWTWYTGSASWMYRLGLEAILGFHKIGDSLMIDPVIPPFWDGFKIHYRYGETIYHIEVLNPDQVSRHVQVVLVNGQKLEDNKIPLLDDHQEHTVVVTLG